MLKIRLITVVILLIGFLAGFFIYHSEKNEYFLFALGLDLRGGAHLVYTADTSELEEDVNVEELMETLKEVIERRVNSQDLSGVFGVLDPIVRTERASIFGGLEERLIIELPGITDIDQAVALIGQTPHLEFMLVRGGEFVLIDEEVEDGEIFIATGLTGRFVQRADVQFEHLTNEPTVLLTFNREGRDLFAEITQENVGNVLAIILDGVVISAPVIRDVIRDGRAIISGNFTSTEARELVRNLNFGALPLPISLSSTQTIGASLGEEVLRAGVMAGLSGFLLVILFLIIWYRFSGFLAAISLIIYVIFIISLFKLIPVTLTAAGIAGFILSIGMAVDANILIFERMKEEIRLGKNFKDAVLEGFSRAWPSIRDGNVSSIITAIILFWFGTSMVQGFALTFGLGVLVSMITAISITRTLLLSIGDIENESLRKNLFGFK